MQMVFDFLNKSGIKHQFPRALKYWVKRTQTKTYRKDFEKHPDKTINDLGLGTDPDSYFILRCRGPLTALQISKSNIQCFSLITTE